MTFTAYQMQTATNAYLADTQKNMYVCIYVYKYIYNLKSIGETNIKILRMRSQGMSKAYIF